MLTRLLTAAAIVSLAAAVAVGVFWWRGAHGHEDALHLGAASPTQTTFTTERAGVFVRATERVGGAINAHGELWHYRPAMGGTLVLPGLWTAIWVRRRLLPRRPDLADLPRVPSRRVKRTSRS